MLEEGDVRLVDTRSEPIVFPYMLYQNEMKQTLEGDTGGLRRGDSNVAGAELVSPTPVLTSSRNSLKTFS